MFLQGLGILALETTAFARVWFHAYDAGYEKTNPFRGADWMIVLIYAFLIFILTRLNGGYKYGHLRTMDVVFSQMLSALGANFIFYFVISVIVRTMVNVGWMGLLTVVDFLMILLYDGFMNLLQRKLYPPRKLLLVYGDKGPMEMIQLFHTRSDKFIIEEGIHAGSDRNEILEKARQYDGIVIHRVAPDLRNELLHLCYEQNIRAYLVPNISDIIFWSCGDTHLFDTPMFVTRNHGISPVEAFLKRTMDIVGSLLMLMIFSPSFLIIALLVKMYDGGPVLYRQERVTRGGRHFQILKFRSMRVNAEDHAVLASKEDDRITPVGRVIRSLHLDELPQLLNVLKGEMSLVGPRPERPEIIQQYKKEIPEFDYRLRVKAGLTGFAQVYGRYRTTSYNKLKMDILYIEHYSIWLDLKILFLTFKILFIRDNSEGVDEKDERGK